MPKRPRSASVEIKGIDDNGIVIGYEYREYYVIGGIEYVKLLTDAQMECKVIHNFENRAILKIESIRSGEGILRQEINPLKYKNHNEWVCDE